MNYFGFLKKQLRKYRIKGWTPGHIATDGSFAIDFSEARVPPALHQQRCWAARPAYVIFAAAFPPYSPRSFLWCWMCHRSRIAPAPREEWEWSNAVMLLSESGPKLHPDFYSSLGAEVRGDLWCLLSKSTEIRLVRCLTLTTCFSAVVDWVWKGWI